MIHDLKPSGRAGARACCDVDTCCGGAHRTNESKIDAPGKHDESAAVTSGDGKKSCCESAPSGSSACCGTSAA